MTPTQTLEKKRMLDELKSDEIVNKVGGRFKLTALVQKRITELLQGSRPLIENAEGKTMLEIAIQEILQDKITIEGMPVGDKSKQSDSEQADKTSNSD